MTQPVTHISFYISSGGGNAMFTLRMSRFTEGNPNYIDRYIKNLSTNLEEAERKAMLRVEEFKSRVEDEYTKVNYLGPEVDEIIKRRGRLSAHKTVQIETIEAGTMPFGKNRGQKIAELPDGYIMWLSDQLKNPDPDAVMQTLASIATGIAMDRNLFEIRDQKRAERRERDLKSNHIGIEKQRLDFEGIIVASVLKDADYSPWWFTKIIVGEDILTHTGRNVGEAGETFKFRARIKRHDIRDDIKSTRITHLKRIEQ
ncbi:hypothetical protein PP939_gp156 [Rhizobium phage RL38J1]|uniref:Uncharacterized protein n=1 Tax=Rhizobium phage RL38J1 TaxID=2663232 RepID=A0A6B9J2U5_9CAUD|nr:hypothetical protein PP939_gp156 [Rhizobium phage RL38J1]QGZ13883.1 hypothetical protein RL38J1_156 [Rhizobium phage RL38J1]